jgi:hypothetical protein
MHDLCGDDRDWDAVDSRLVRLWQELGFPKVDRSRDELAEWVVVVEIALPSEGRRFDLAALEELIDALGDQQPSALFSDDRYALQLHLMARSATEAVDFATCAHQLAAARIGFRALSLLRAEVISHGEFEQSCQDQLDTCLDPAQPDNVSVPHDVYQATRAIFGATTAGQVVDVLVDFVVAVGGSVGLGPAPLDGSMIAIPLGITGRPMFGAADAFSVAGLLLEGWLPLLVADAQRVLERLSATAGA